MKFIPKGDKTDSRYDYIDFVEVIEFGNMDGGSFEYFDEKRKGEFFLRLPHQCEYWDIGGVEEAEDLIEALNIAKHYIEKGEEGYVVWNREVKD